MSINVDLVKIQSGLSVQISGQHVYVESGVHVASGLHVVADVQVDVSSGIHVLVSGQHMFVESGVNVVSDIKALWLGNGSIPAYLNVICDSSGRLLTNISGMAVDASGSHVYVESGVNLMTPTEIIVNPLVNPQLITSASGGEPLTSGPSISVVVKCCTSNTGVMYIGGENHLP